MTTNATHSEGRGLPSGVRGRGSEPDRFIPDTFWLAKDKWTRLAQRADLLVAHTLRPLSLLGLRILLGVLFVWFGGLKVAGSSPVSALVAGTLPWADPHMIVPVLGGAEVLLGLGLVTGLALRLVLPVLAVHLAGTFLTFLMLPELMFRHHNLLLLTGNGEFVAKNLVLISATIVLITHASGSEPPYGRRRFRFGS
jgi:putative oxidoreductase